MKVEYVYNKNAIMQCEMVSIPRIGDTVILDMRRFKVSDVAWCINTKYDDIVKVVVV